MPYKCLKSNFFQTINEGARHIRTESEHQYLLKHNATIEKWLKEWVAAFNKLNPDTMLGLQKRKDYDTEYFIIWGTSPDVKFPFPLGEEIADDETVEFDDETTHYGDVLGYVVEPNE
jgi:hypothetical protein